MTKVAVIGNTNWQNKRKVQETLRMLKTKFPDNLVILGAGGAEGANSYVRKYALEFGMDYSEFNPSFSGYNLYSAMPEAYYGKKYHFSQLHHRMKLILIKIFMFMILLKDCLLYLNTKKEWVGDLVL